MPVVFRKMDPVSFNEEPQTRRAAANRNRPADKSASVERDLASTREHLRAVIAEREAASEEMKAILCRNEDLRNINKRLETANEELRSANRELVAEHKKLQGKAQRRATAIRSLLESVPQSVIAIGPDETIVLVNANTETMFGYRREELLGRRLNILIPEARRRRHASHQKNYFANLQTRPMGMGLTLEARRKNGSVFPVEVGLSAIETARRKLAVAFVSDITQRARLEATTRAHSEQMNALASKLLIAQEEERRRVSRELHDEICQELAALAIDIGTLAAHAPPPDREAQLKALRRRVVKASEKARHLAYGLHPSMLDDLGVVAALRALCQEFSERNPNVVLEFTSGEIPASIRREAASCVFRVAQESLRNVAKHSKAEHVSVDLGLEKGALALTVKDDGAGFDPTAVKGRGGLGLVGAEERARLLDGKLTVTSKSGRGTRIALVIRLA